MKKFILLFIIILIAVFSYSYEFKLLPVAGNNIEWSNIAHYKDSVYYHIFSNSEAGAVVGINYLVGDTISSPATGISPSAVAPYYGEIDTDTAGRAYFAWIDQYDSTKTAVYFQTCNDTSFNFMRGKLVDTLSSAESVYHTYLNIDVTDNGQFIFIVYDKVYYIDSGDSVIVDSAKIYYVSSSDSGLTFSPPRPLLQSGTFAFEPDIAWDNATNTAFVIYSVFQNDSGFINMNTIVPPFFQADQTIYSIDSTGNALNPVVEFRQDSVFAVYAALNQVNGYANIKMKVFDDPALLLDSAFINPAPRKQSYPQMTLDDLRLPHISYYDSIDNNNVAMFSYYDEGAGNYRSDWMLWTAQKIIKRPEIVFFDSTHMYFNLLVPDGSNIYSYICSAKPDKAPGPPENMKVNGDTISHWYSSTPVNVSWDNPFDYSSIMRAYVKVGNPPAGNNDTTFTLQDTIIAFNNPYQGSTGVYVWLMDYKGNIDYNNFARINVKYDTIPPDKPPLKVNPADSSVVNNRQFDVIFKRASDNESGIMEYKLEIDTLPAMTSPKSVIITDTVFTVDTSLFTEPFMDRRYFWNVTAYDSAGNAASANIYSFLLMATRRVNQIYPAQNDTVKNPVECTINAIRGYDAAIEKYRFVFAADSILSTIIIDTVIGSSFNDTIFAVDDFTQNTVYWTVSAVNKAGTETAFSDTQRFFVDNFIDSIAPVISRLRPYDGSVVNNSRPVIRADIDDNAPSGWPTNVQLLIDGKTVSPDVSDTMIVFTPAFDLGDTIHNINLHIEDRAGNSADTTWSFSIDIKSPLISGITPVPGSNVPDRTPEITVYLENVKKTAKEDSGIDSVFLSVNSEDVSGELTVSDSMVSYTPSIPLEDSVNNIDFYVRDSGGNYADSSWSFNLDFMHHSYTYSPESPVIGDTVEFTLFVNRDSLEFDSSYISWDDSLRTVEFTHEGDSLYKAHINTAGVETGIFELYASFSDIYDNADSLAISVDLILPEAMVNEQDIYCWPNPVSDDNINIRIKVLHSADADIGVYTLKGVKAIESSVNLAAGEKRNVSLDISSLGPDMYFVIITIQDSEGNTETIKRKFVRVK